MMSPMGCNFCRLVRGVVMAVAKKAGLSLNVQIKEVQVEIAKHKDKLLEHNNTMLDLRNKLVTLQAQKSRGKK